MESIVIEINSIIIIRLRFAQDSMFPCDAWKCNTMSMLVFTLDKLYHREGKSIYKSIWHSRNKWTNNISPERIITTAAQKTSV